MNEKTCDFLIVGAGVIGVAIARELRRRHGAKVVVLEKEVSAGLHASGRKSGVLHAGVYYKAGTLKARLCVEGNRRSGPSQAVEIRLLHNMARSAHTRR